MTSSSQKPLLSDFESMENLLEDKQPIEASFELAIEGLSKHLTVEADEESITAAFLGGVTNNYPWCALMSTMVEDSVTECSWAQYNKSGGGTTAEPQSGADFALILHREDEYVDIAIFQAKKGHTDSSISNHNNMVDVHRVRDVNGIAVSQIVTLHDASLELFKIAKGTEGGIKDLAWVHYLCYYKQQVRCLQLSCLEKQVRQAKAGGHGSYLDVELTESNSRHWIEVLHEGVSGNPFPGWLRMKFEDAQANLPKLLPLMNVVIVDEGRGGRSLEFSNHPAVASKVIKRKGVRETLKKKLNTNKPAPKKISTPKRGMSGG